MSKTNSKEKFLENILKQVILLVFSLIVWFVSEEFDIDLFYLLRSLPIKYSVIIVLLLLLSSAVILIYYSRINSERTSKRKTLKYSMLIMICISLLISLGLVLPTMNLSAKIPSIERNHQEYVDFKEACIRKIGKVNEQKRLGLLTTSEYWSEMEKIGRMSEHFKEILSTDSEKE